MGIAAGTETITLETRYIGLRINKGSALSIFVDVETGYFDQGVWTGIRRKVITIEGDALWYVMGLKAPQLGLDNPNVLTLLDTLVYGVITGQVPITAHLTVTATDPGTGEHLNGRVRVHKGAVVYLDTPIHPEGHTIPLLLGATVSVLSPGYEAWTQVVPVLAGDAPLAASLRLEAGNG